MRERKQYMTNRNVYDAFAAAWAAGDADRCVALMTENALYGASIGPEPGRTFAGSAEIREGIKAMIAHDNAVSIEITSWTEVGSTAFVEWRYHLADGGLALGIDLVAFEDGQISRKDAYRKVHHVVDQ